ncbi:hypothetical protein [Lysinibacillus antri]|uniref:Uncharacterized protein n=1 Tax=Lysinibacillus antri TaxID=2498145 RepID=A0A432LFC5_9BACI|nr:hypothetical protein [Lysinibacillus antri]RUL56376.1 hypothetical protein EK386_01705 [Lysinibacillus antri]
MVFFKTVKSSHPKTNLTFPTILEKVNIQFETIPKNKCDQRTLYVTISINYNREKVYFDLIFLLDRPEIFGAISINEQYDKVRYFFKQQFNHTLCYENELLIAEQFMKTKTFKEVYSDITSRSKNEKRPHDKRAVSQL